ncbi:MAG: triose-phosphate isomerase [Deltaproteobacteria bacterium]|nr:triose-phosphate isomerase [Deltaproteobacteria bacterium]
MEEPVKPLMVANWKMYNNVSDSIKLATNLKNSLGDYPDVEVVLAPPFTSIYSVSIAMSETGIKVGAQNCFWGEEGPYTGEVSAPFLKDAGCEYVIIGHSERRIHFAETDESVNKKIHCVLNADLTPILCVGETAHERNEKKTTAVIEKQIRRGLQDVGMNDLQKFVVAYEPVWAIGSGNRATVEQIAEAHEHIRFLLARMYDAPTANNIRILYGGSVKSSNVREVMKVHHVDGALVGSASLDYEEFSKIIRFGDFDA